MSSVKIVAASVLQNTASSRMFWTPGIAGNAVPKHTMLNSPVCVCVCVCVCVMELTSNLMPIMPVQCPVSVNEQ